VRRENQGYRGRRKERGEREGEREAGRESFRSESFRSAGQQVDNRGRPVSDGMTVGLQS
jgi:hypothetical protein